MSNPISKQTPPSRRLIDYLADSENPSHCDCGLGTEFATVHPFECRFVCCTCNYGGPYGDDHAYECRMNPTIVEAHLEWALREDNKRNHFLRIAETRKMKAEMMYDSIIAGESFRAEIMKNYKGRVGIFGFVGANIGRIIRNATPSEWKAMSYFERLQIAQIEGYELDSFSNYRHCHIEKVDENVRNVLWSFRMTRSMTNNNAGHILREHFDLKDTTMTLSTALILKDLGLMPELMDICGVIKMTQRPNVSVEMMFGDVENFDFNNDGEDLEYQSEEVELQFLDGISLFSVKGLPSNVANAITSAIDQTSADVKKSGDTVTSILESIASFFPHPSIGVLVREQGLHFAAFLMDLAKSILHGTFLDNALSLTMRLVGIVGLPAQILTCLSSVMDSARSMVSKRATGIVGDTRPLKLQAGPDSTGSIIAAIMGVLITGKALNADGTKKVGEMARLFNTLVASTTKLETLLHGLLQWIPKCVKDWISFMFPGLTYSENEKIINDYRDACERAVQLLDARADPLIIFDTEYRNMVRNSLLEIRRVYDIVEMKQNDAVFRGMTIRTVGLEERLRKIQKEIDALAFDKTGRPTPFVVTFYGDSGVGKSTVALKLANKYAPSDAQEQRVYVRNATDDFWSGYHNQDFVVIDDQGQETVKHQDLNEMFAMVSTATFMPPMATIDNGAIGVKGTKFDSKAIFICTNNPFPAACGLYHKTALNRRRHMLVKVTLKDVAAPNGVPNPAELKSDFSHLLFTQMDSVVENKVASEAMDYEHFCAVFESKIKQHYERENAVYKKSFDEAERKPLLCFEGWVTNLFHRPAFEALSESETHELLLKPGQPAGTYDRLLYTALSEGVYRVPAMDYAGAQYGPALAMLALISKNELKVLAELVLAHGFFDGTMVRHFRAYSDAISAAALKAHSILYLLDNIELMPQTNLTIAQKARITPYLWNLKHTATYRMVVENEFGRDSFMLKYPTISKFLSIALDGAVVGAIAFMLYKLWKVLSPGADAVVYQSYDRSAKNPLNNKRKAPVYVLPKRGALRYESFILAATDLTPSDDVKLRDKLVSYGVDPQRAQQVTSDFAFACNEVRKSLDPSVVSRMRNGPDVDEVTTKFVQTIEKEKFADAVENATEIELQGLVSDIFKIDEQADRDQIDHLREEGYNDIDVTAALEILKPVSEALREVLDGAPAETKEFVKADFTAAILDTFRDQPAIVAMLDGSLACQSINHGRSVTFVDNTPVKLQGADDAASVDVIEKCVLPYMLYLMREGVGLCTFPIGGKDLLTPTHFWLKPGTNEIIEDGTLFTIMGSSDYIVREERFERKRLRILSIDSVPSDASIYRCSSRVRSYRKRYNMFIRDADLSHLSSTPGSLISCRMNMPVVNEINIYLTKIASSVTDENRKVLKTIPKAWRYSAPTTKGMCGGLLVAHKTTLPRKFLGMHFAAGRTTSMSYGQIVTQEMMQPALDSLNAEYGEPVEGVMVGEELNDPALARVYFQGDFSRFGTVARSKEVRPATKTRLVESVINGVYPVKRAPAALTPNDPRIDPEHRGQSLIGKSVSKYGKMSRPFEEDLVNEIVTDIFSTISAEETHVPIRDATLDEAINGNIFIPHCERLNLHTSAGYPFVLEKPEGTTGKNGWFTGTEEKREMLPLLEERVNFRMANAIRGKRVASVWTDNMKDELRPIEKIKTGGTRTFTIGPMDYTIAFRKWFLMFCCHFMTAKLKFFSAIGMDPESHDWTLAEDRMREVSDLGFAGDYSRWDGVMSAQIMDAVCNAINDWYNGTPESSMARRVLFDEMIHTPVLCINLLYGQHGGNPSGNPMTAIINTIVNAVYLRYAYMKLAPPSMRSLVIYNKYVRDLIYGDDNRISAHPKILEFFNMHTVSAFFATLGITYTSASKEQAKDVPAFEPLENLTFLKRGFRLVGKTWLPLMALDTVYDLCNWVRECDDQVQACVDNCNSALRYMFHYGKVPFNEMRKNVLEAFKRRGHNPQLFTFEYFNNYFDEYSRLPTASMEVDIDGLEYQSDRVEKHEIKQILANASNRHGQIMMEAGAVSRAAPSHGATVATKMVDNSFISAGDQRWKIEDTANRYTYVATLNWQTSDTPLQVKAFYEVPLDLLTSAMNQMPFTYFLYWEGEVTIRFEMPGTPFHQGMLVALFLPHATPQMVASIQAYKSLITQLTHVFLEANKSGAVELKIPFAHFRDFISLSDENAGTLDFNSLGRVYLMVFNQLNAGTGASTTLPVSVFVSFSQKGRFAVPVGRAPTSFRASLRDGENLTFQAGEGFLSNFFAPIMAKIMPKNIVGDAIDALGGGNMDYPNNPVQPKYVITRSSHMGYLSNSAQVGEMEVLGYDPSERDNADVEDFKSLVDETDIAFLLKKMTWAQTVNWSTSDGVNTILASGALKPFGREESALEASGGTPVETGIANFLAAMHSKWRGSLRRGTTFVAGGFQTGKLYFGVHYGRTTVPASMTEAMDQFGMAINLGEDQRDYVLDIPYNALTKWLYVPNGRNTDSVPERSSMGTWSLRVVNPLVAPAGIPNFVQINISEGVGDDFQMADPGLTNWSLVPVSYQGLTDHDTPWGALGNEMKTIDNDAPVNSNKSETPTNEDVGPSKVLDQGLDQKTQFVISRGKKARRFGTGCLYPMATLTEYLKRFHPIGPPFNFQNQNSGETPDVYGGICGFPIHNLIWGFQKMTGTPAYLPLENNTNIFWNRITGMYRWARGSLRIKATLTDSTHSDQPLKLTAFHYRRMKWPTSNAAATSQQITANATTPLSEIAVGALFPYIGMPNEATTVAVGVAPTIEFEIPWSSVYNMNLCRQNNSAFSTFNQSNIYSSGMLFFTAGVVGQFSSPPAYTDFNLHVWVAAGDDFHLGGFLGAPPVQAFTNLNAGASQEAWPDSYYTTD